MPKWSQMVPNSSEKVPNGPQTVHMVPNYLKWSQIFRKGPKWSHIWEYLKPIRGDLLRSVPFIMGGHLNMDFFQVVFAQVFDTNPKSICLMMIHKHSGRAPRPFQHLLLAMSALEMSGHDTKRLSWFFWSKSFQNEILCVKYINKTYYNAYFYFSDYCAASKSGKMGTVHPCQNHVWTSRN